MLALGSTVQVMAQFDEFLRQQVSAQLDPSETIVGMGLMRSPTRTNAAGVASQYDEWFAVATTQRLMLLRTEATGLLRLRPKAICHELRQWWYADLLQVRLSDTPGAGQGHRLELVARPAAGPFQGEARSYDLFPNVEELELHEILYAHYGSWLEQQLALGGHTVEPEARARAEAFERLVRLSASVAEANASPSVPPSLRTPPAPPSAATLPAALAASPPAKPRKQRPWLVALLVLLPVAAGLIVGGIYLVTGLLRFTAARPALVTAKWEVELDEADVAWVRAGGEPPADCPEAARANEVPARAKLCHGCTVQGSSVTEYGSRTFKRGNDYWLCPSASRYEDKLAGSTKARKKAQKRYDLALHRTVIGGVVTGVSLLVGGVLGFWLRRRARRRRAAELQAAALATLAAAAPPAPEAAPVTEQMPGVAPF